MSADDIKKKIMTQKFIQNNGKILRTLNILATKECTIGKFMYLMNDSTKEEFASSLLYLSDSGYIRILHAEGVACLSLDEYQYNDVRLELTSTGMELLMGVKENEAVDI